MNELITNNPRGLSFTWAVRVRGLPYLYTDGRATWNLATMTTLPATLGSTDFGFTANANALDSTDVGTGIKIELVDTPAGELRRMFSPQYFGAINTRLIQDAPADGSTSIFVVDTTGINANDILYIGNEALQADVIVSSTEIEVSRGLYGGLPIGHRMQLTEDGALGPRVTSSPRVFRGRYVEVFVAAIMPDGSAGDHYTWWAGRVASVKLHARAITLDVDPLNAAIEQDEWPFVTASGNLSTLGGQFALPQASAYCQLQLEPEGDAARYVDITLGYYDSSNTFTTLPTGSARYTYAQLLTALSHTIQKAMLDTGESEADGARNKFSLFFITGEEAIVQQNLFGENLQVARYTNNTLMNVRLVDSTGFGAMLKSIAATSPFRFNPRFYAGQQDEWACFLNNTNVVLPNADSIQLSLDSRWRPFTVTGYDNTTASPIGYAKISDGDELEIISYTSATLDADGRTLVLGGVVRGVANTTAQTWPRPDNNGRQQADVDASKVRIEQLFFSSFNENSFLWRVINALLVSSSPYTIQFNGPFDYFGEYGGLGIPQDFVWYEDIQDKLSRQYFPKIFMFFVSEPGKGKDEFQQWLKLFGIHLVTRRFKRDETWHYGLTVDVVDSTRLTRYNETATDADRKAGSEPSIDIDEHIVINQISYRPIYKFGEDASDANVGGMRYVYSEESITDYGAAKMMELKASAMFLGAQVYDGVYTTTPEDLQTGIATETALRWFGVYDRAVNFLEFEAPHVAWRLQPGDQVLLSMTGVPSPTGARSLSDTVGKVVRVQYRTGSNAGATIRLMLTNTAAVDWVPSARITSTGSGTNLTLAANEFTSTSATFPAIFGDLLPDYDGRFFRPTVYDPSAALPVVIYDARDYAGTAVNTTITGYTNATSVTVGTSIASLSNAASSGYLYMSLRAYNALASARYNAHAWQDQDKELT